MTSIDTQRLQPCPFAHQKFLAAPAPTVKTFHLGSGTPLNTESSPLMTARPGRSLRSSSCVIKRTAASAAAGFSHMIGITFLRSGYMRSASTPRSGSMPLMCPCSRPAQRPLPMESREYPSQARKQSERSTASDRFVAAKADPFKGGPAILMRSSLAAGQALYPRSHRSSHCAPPACNGRS